MIDSKISSLRIDREELIELLKDMLTIEVKTTSNYTGGLDGGSMYSDNHTIQLLLDGTVISEASL